MVPLSLCTQSTHGCQRGLTGARRGACWRSCSSDMQEEQLCLQSSSSRICWGLFPSHPLSRVAPVSHSDVTHPAA